VIAAIARYVERNPGLTCAEIASALGLDPSVVSAVLRKLRVAGTLKKKGNTRASTWFAK
jgi:DNA-binding MarR family transcriptional regulator